MGLLVDRHRDKVLTIKTGKGAGRSVMAKAVWRNTNDFAPPAIRIAVQNDDGSERIIAEHEGPFLSIEQTEEIALAFATDWYDRGNG